jgi:hypothetical protein
MRELIRHILKENRLQQELKQVIKDGNIFDAADLVGGISPLKKIFKDDPEMSSLFEKLIGRIIFDYYVNKEHIEFPLDYEIIGRKSNNHKTNHWPEINVLYDENKLTPEENDTFKSIIKNLADDAQHSGFKSKFDDGLAKVTDDANFERHIAKIALQKRFFDSDLTEFKNRN